MNSIKITFRNELIRNTLETNKHLNTIISAVLKLAVTVNLAYYEPDKALNVLSLTVVTTALHSILWM